jgi:hypothetical protein
MSLLDQKKPGLNVAQYSNFIFLFSMVLIVFALAVALVLKESAGVV